jgi:hypothetical protein
MNDSQFITLLYQKLLRREPEAGAVEGWLEAVRAGSSIADVTTAFITCEEFEQLQAKRPQHFVPPGHFYSPVVDTQAVKHLFESNTTCRSVQGIHLCESEQLAKWCALLPYLKTLPFSDAHQHGLRYRFDNPSFGIGDAGIYCAMLQHHRPRRLVEVGSGFSSACALDTIQHCLGLEVAVTFVEPHPELLTSLLTEPDRRCTTVIAQGIQDVDLSVFRALDEGDFLFIDSTHVLKTGSDVHHELFEVLPALKPGVIIHIHDIFWPFEYPRSWVVDENRSWNELYALRAFLTNNDDYRIEFFNDYFAQNFRSAIEQDCPALLQNRGGSLWLRKIR